ncbi:hypothetical protein [Lunatimonas salinarum]|uniref:hypothetical protein n=1 Tax=Lunatimonas salinarum TaxID=1774590 RepID=UPI001ADFF24C|nr:hypothetical protein [Lunatimonas salinarum]
MVRLRFLLPILLLLLAACTSDQEEPNTRMEEEVFFQLNVGEEQFEYRYRLAENYLNVDGGLGFVEQKPDAQPQNYLVFVNQLDILLIDVDGHCTINPGANACFFANFSFSPQSGTKQESGIISFLVGNYTLNKQRTNDPNMDVFFEVEVTRTSQEQRLMEGTFRGKLFTRIPSGRIPETTPRIDVHGSFRVGMIGEMAALSLPTPNRLLERR